MANKSQEDERTELERRQLEQLKLIEERLFRLTSLRWNFTIGIFRGLATVIGATIVAALFFAFFGWFLQQVDVFPLVQDIIEQTEVKDAVQQEF